MQMISYARGFHMFAYAITTLTPGATPRTTCSSASVPVLGALIALFLLQHWDHGLFDQK